jgi:hypothetical protein
MSTVSLNTKKPIATATSPARDLSGQALLKDMRAYKDKDKVTASPAAARDFLVGLGVLTEQGKANFLSFFQHLAERYKKATKKDIADLDRECDS